MLDDSVFLDGATTFTSGNDGFLGRRGVEQTHDASASAPGVYTVEVTVTDDDGGSDSVSLTKIVG